MVNSFWIILLPSIGTGEPARPQTLDDVVAKTTAKYLEAYEKLTGKKL